MSTVPIPQGATIGDPIAQQQTQGQIPIPQGAQVGQDQQKPQQQQSAVQRDPFSGPVVRAAGAIGNAWTAFNHEAQQEDQRLQFNQSQRAANHQRAVAQGQIPQPAHVTPNEFSTLLQSGMSTLQQSLSQGIKGVQQWAAQNPSFASYLHSALNAVRGMGAQMASAEQQRLLAGQVEQAKTEQAPEPTRSEVGPEEVEMAPEPETPESASAGADMPEDPAAAAEKSPYQSPYGNLVEQAAATHGVDAGLINAMMAQESGGKPGAVSPKGATGLMQLMPGTAKDLGLKGEEVKDPAKNIEAGVRYFKQQLDRYGGDVRKALAAYNAGPGRVPKAGALILSKLPKETQNYVKSIMKKWGGDQEEITAREGKLD